MALAAIAPASRAQSPDATALPASFVVAHGIPGRDVAPGLDPLLPVDVLIAGKYCLLKGLTFGTIAGPFDVPAGKYAFAVSLAPPPLTKIAKADLPPAPAPHPPAPVLTASQAVALLSATGADHPAMKAFLSPGGSVRLVPVQKLTIAADKQLGFWVWPHGLALPIPIGRLPAEGGTLRFPYGVQDGTPVMVTFEPRGLPVTDAQGTTLFQGQMVMLSG